MSGPPIDYDPRRFFPFGLSPIPELPSELASEVSSLYSYGYNESEDGEAEGAEEEEPRSPASIMYSGSCSSVKSNLTINDDKQEEDSSTEHESSSSSEESSDSGEDEDEEEEDEDEQEVEVNTQLQIPEELLEQENKDQDEGDQDDQEDQEDQDDQDDMYEAEDEVEQEVEQEEDEEVEQEEEEEEEEVEQEEEEEEEEEEDEEDEEEEDEEENNDFVADDTKDDQDQVSQSNGEGHLYSSQVMSVTHQRAFPTKPVQADDNNKSEIELIPSNIVELTPSTSTADVVPSASHLKAGAVTASEIFHHLQATREKEEVTTDLAKILNVLQTTLTQESSTSSESSDSSEGEDQDQKDKPPDDKPASPKVLPPLGKPPKYPNSLRGRNMRSAASLSSQLSNKVSPDIQQRIRDLATIKPESGKDEMSILSKILVTLLCSCKSAEATSELKRIIRQFRDAATEATDEVGDDLIPINSRSSSRVSSRRRRKCRSRRSSANSNASQSEPESLTNTLTPCNTDSKSSGTEDEGQPVNIPPAVSNRSLSTPTNSETPTRLKVEVIVDKKVMVEPDPNVTFTISLPRRLSTTEDQSQGQGQKSVEAKDQQSDDEDDEDGDNEEENEEEWEWDEDEDAEANKSSTSSAEEKFDHSSTDSTTRKLLTDMECGAYNSDSLYSPGHSAQASSEQSNESPAVVAGNESDTEEWITGQEEDEEDDDNKKRREIKPIIEEEDEDEDESGAEGGTENLYSHLEETFRVLDGAYRIITSTAQQEGEPAFPPSFGDGPLATIVKGSSATTITDELELKKTFVEALGKVTTACANLENEVKKTVSSSSRGTSRPPSRSSSKMSRPGSRRSTAGGEDEGEEEEWGDEEAGDWEWEYYYEEDESAQKDIATIENTTKVNTKGEDDQKIKPVEEVTNAEDKNVDLKEVVPEKEKTLLSRPVSRQRKVPVSRPGSRTGSRPGSRPSSRASRMEGLPLDGVQEEEEGDWEWEYYYEEDEEDEELRGLSPTATTAPTTRATSPFPEEQPRNKPLINRADIVEPPQEMWEECGRIPDQDQSMELANEIIHADPNLTTNIDLSVALAAEYLGQKKEDVAASLPADFMPQGQDVDEMSEKTHKTDKRSHKRSKKKGDGKFLPKIGVKDLVNMLEPQLFKDDESGTKMVMQEDTAKYSIAKKRKRRSHKDPMDSKSAGKVQSLASVMKQSVANAEPTETSQLPLHIYQTPVKLPSPTQPQLAAPVAIHPGSSYYQAAPQAAVFSPIQQQQPSVMTTSFQPQFQPPYSMANQQVQAQYSQPPYQQSPFQSQTQFQQHQQSQSQFQQHPQQPQFQSQAQFQQPQQPPSYVPQQAQYASYVSHHSQQYQSNQIPAPPPPPPQLLRQPSQFIQDPQPRPEAAVIIRDPSNPGQVQVLQDGTSTMVTMRPKQQQQGGARSKDAGPSISRQDKLPSPSDSEAYGTGSSVSEAVENVDDDDNNGDDDDGETRHSRLFRLLQDSDYNDSDNEGFMRQLTLSKAYGTSIPTKTSWDEQPVRRTSPPEDHPADTTYCARVSTGAIERKHSFRSIRSSGRESDGDSITSDSKKVSPPMARKTQGMSPAQKRFMNLNLQSCYNMEPITPSSSELSTPSSPLMPAYGAAMDSQYGSLERRKHRLSAPTTPSGGLKPVPRTWSCIGEEGDLPSPSYYMPFESLDELAAAYPEAGREVEEVLRRRALMATNPIIRSKLNASPITELSRGSPTTIIRPTSLRNSPTIRNSPKLELDMTELPNPPQNRDVIYSQQQQPNFQPASSYSSFQASSGKHY